MHGPSGTWRQPAAEGNKEGAAEDAAGGGVGEEGVGDALSPDRGERRDKRRLYRAAVGLKAVVEEELAAELRRDAEDGAAAIPPFAPGGWTVRHPAGSSYFTMMKAIPGSSRVAPDEEEEVRLSRRHALLEEDVCSAAGEPRFRSVRDDADRGRRPLPTAGSPSAHPGSSSGELWGEAIPTFPYSKQMQQQRRLSPSKARAPVPRSNVHVTLFAPFQVQDLSLYDPNNSICEYAPFDVLVQKTPPAALSTWPASRPETPPPLLLKGHQRVWDTDTAMFLRLASVNSELRLRSVGFLSDAVARRVEEGACFGRGDPLFVALLARHTPVARRQERLQRLREQRQRRRTRERELSAEADELSPPMNRFFTHHKGSPSPPAASARRRALSPAEALLKTDFTVSGSVARAQLYQGPYLSELSNELRDALLTYVMTDIGITPEVREYVCQMQYFMEQEEYMGWLARWRHVADRLQRCTPTP